MSALAATTKTPAIFWTLDNEFDQEDPFYIFQHESGRTFYLSVMEQWEDNACREVFYPQEATPSDYLMIHNTQGYVIDREESATLKALNQDPNRFFLALEEHNIPIERLLFDIGGYGLGSITYPTREEANQAVWQAIHDNAWLEHHSQALAEKTTQSRDYQQQMHDASVQYHHSMIAQLEAGLANDTALFRGTGSWIASVKNDKAIHQALLSFRNAPSLVTWQEISNRVILPSGNTGWQVWTQHDAQAPTMLGPEGFTYHPDPEQFLGWISQCAETALAFHREKLDALKSV